MNKYELALVVNAKIEDDVENSYSREGKRVYRSLPAVLVTEVEDWGKKKLSLRHPEDERSVITTSFSLTLTQPVPAEVEQHVRIMENVHPLSVCSQRQA